MKLINLTNIGNFFGKSKSSKIVRELLESIDEVYKISRFPTCHYYIYKQSGIEICFNKENYLQTIIIHNRAIENTPGIQLPYNLDISDIRKIVEEKLGVPERGDSHSTTIEVWTGHPELGLNFTYQTIDVKNFDAKIKHICFSEPESEINRIRFLTKIEIFAYLQIYSKTYSSAILTELLQVEPTRLSSDEFNILDEDENLAGYNFWEIYLSENPHLGIKNQLKTVLNFIKKKEKVIVSLSQECIITLKFTLNSLISNSTNFLFDQETLKYISDLGIGIKFEFNT